MTDRYEACHLCALHAEALRKRHSVSTCRSCMTVFWFAEVLLEADPSRS